MLLTGLRGSVMDSKADFAVRFADWIDYAKPVLERTGVVTYNDDGHHFVSMKRLQWLQIDAMRQLYDNQQDTRSEVEILRERVAELETQVEYLQGRVN
jgi:hypothetical protein